MYNFEEIKEVIIPYLDGMYSVSFIMHPYKPENKILYSKDDVLIIAHNNLDDRFIECLGLTEEHRKIIRGIEYKIYKECMDAEFKLLEEKYKDDTSDVYENLTEEEYRKMQAEIEEMEQIEAAEWEESQRYWENVDPYDIGNDPHALCEARLCAIRAHLEELIPLVGHTIDTIACELQVPAQSVERIMSALTNKIKETTNL